jgi:phenylacetic acid degradation operon negative regulatory protein
VLPVRSIVRTTELFGISEGTTRVALSRLVADDDVVAEDSRYRLSDRLVARQRRLDEGRAPATRPWRAGWEMAVIGPEVRGSGERATVGAELAALRLGELRSGVWVRPANLRRDWPGSLRDRVWRFEVRRIGDSTTASAGRSSAEPWPPAEDTTLATSLWDLQGWASQAEALLAAFAPDETPAHRFMTAAAIVRHLETDPLLPAPLLPAQWPGPRLRQAYAGYERELGDLFRRERRRHG